MKFSKILLALIPITLYILKSLLLFSGSIKRVKLIFLLCEIYLPYRAGKQSASYPGMPLMQTQGRMILEFDSSGPEVGNYIKFWSQHSGIYCY